MNPERESVLSAAQVESPEADSFELHPIRKGLWAVEAFEHASDGTPSYHVTRYFMSIEPRVESNLRDSVAQYDL
jgi:hypothetical protein